MRFCLAPQFLSNQLVIPGWPRTSEDEKWFRGFSEKGKPSLYLGSNGKFTLFANLNPVTLLMTYRRELDCEHRKQHPFIVEIYHGATLSVESIASVLPWMQSRIMQYDTSTESICQERVRYDNKMDAAAIADGYYLGRLWRMCNPIWKFNKKEALFFLDKLTAAGVAVPREVLEWIIKS